MSLPMLKLFASYFTETQHGHNHETTSTTHPIDDDAAGAHLERLHSVEELSALQEGSVAGSTRGQPNEVLDKRAGIKRTRESEDERRLVPRYYDVPNDAQPLLIPGQPEYNSRNDWKLQKRTSPTAASMGQPLRSYGVKPTNTLNNSSAQSAQGSEKRSFFSGYESNTHRWNTNTAEPTSLVSLPPKRAVSSMGSNVMSPRTSPEGAHMHGASKRRKIEERASVDLVSDDDFMASVQAVARTKDITYKGSPQVQVPIPKYSNKQMSKHGFMPFKRTELRRVDQSWTAPKLKRNKSNGSMRSSHDGAALRSNPSGYRRGSQQRPLAVDDIEVSYPSSTVKYNLDDLPHGMGRRHIPQIDLERGLEEAGQEQRQKTLRRELQGSHQDLRNVNEVFHEATHQRRNAHPRTNQNANQQPRHIEQAEGHFESRSRGDGKTSVEDLRHRFARDQPLPGTSLRQRAPMRMQASSTRVSRETDSGDDDILDGPSTMGSRASGHVLLQKSQPSSTRNTPVEIDVVRSSRQSPSDIIPTPFKRNARQSSHVTNKQTALVPKHDIETDDARIPIDSIFCKACVSTEKGLELEWDQSRMSFLLKKNGTEVRTPDDTRVVSIGNSEVNSWLDSSGSLAVRLKGPKNKLSSGTIILVFGTENAQKNFRDLMLHFNTVFRVETTSDEQLVKMISHQQTGQKRIYASEVAGARADKISKAPVSNSQYAGDYGEGEIIYDSPDEEPEQRSRAATRMQSNYASANAPDKDVYRELRQARGETDSISKYFEPRRSTRTTTVRGATQESTPPPLPRWTEIHNPPAWRRPVVYPSDGPRRVTVDFKDLGRLDEGQFLNDNVVNFELRYIEEHMDPKHRQKIHFFNTFFYSALSSKNGKKGLNYSAVERWTKNVDLFSVPYIVVPINVDLHWFVAVICNLNMIQRKFSGFEDNEGGVEGSVEDITPGVAQVEVPQSEYLPGRTDEHVPSVHAEAEPKSDSIASGDERLTKGINIPAASTIPGPKTKKRAPAFKKYDTDEPVIITLDSFGQTRSVDLKYLKQYVSMEAAAKRDIAFEPQSLPGMTAKGLPEQSNFCDCGVYLCGYVAKFAQNPDQFVRKVLRREMNASKDFDDGFDASALRGHIRDRILKLQKEQDTSYIAEKKVRAAARKLQTLEAQGSVAAGRDTLVPPSSAPSSAIRSSPARPSPRYLAEPTIASRHTSPLDVIAQGPKSPDATVRDDEDLEVSPPRALGEPRGNHEASFESSESDQSDSDSDSDEDDEDEDMLDDVDRDAVSDPRRQAASTSGDNLDFKSSQTMPFPANPYAHTGEHSSARAQGKALLDVQHDVNRVATGADEWKEVIDIDTEDDVMIPDSQPKEDSSRRSSDF